MSDIFVKSDSVLQVSCELKTIAGNIESVAEESKKTINRAVQLLTRFSIHSGAIRSDILACSEELLQLSDCLENVANQYDFSEENVKNKKFYTGSYGAIVAGVGSIGQTSITDLISSRINNLLKLVKSCENPDLGDKMKEYLNFGSSLLNGVKKLNGDDDAAFISQVFSYFGTLSGAVLSEQKSIKSAITDYLSLTESSGKVWSGMYNWLEKSLSPYEAAKLSEKFGSASRGVSIISGLTGLVKDGADFCEVFSDPESSVYDKAAGILDLLGSAGEVGGKAYITSLSKSKSLQFVNGSKAGNQILADMKLEFTNSEAVTKTISKVNTGLTIGKTAVSTMSGLLKRFGEVKEDGSIDGRDVGSIGVYGSLSGLDSMINSVTCGIIDIDSEKVAADLESDIDDFLQRDNWAANYINDHENPGISRFAVSIGGCAYVLGENIVDGVVSGVNSVGSWISDGYNAVKNWIN